MNTISATFAKLTRLTAKVVVVLALAAGTVVAVQPAAQAATGVKFCARHQTGQAYVGPVFLKNAATGATVKSGKTGTTGCTIFTGVPSNITVYVRAAMVYGNTTIGLAIYAGSTTTARPGSGTANVGTATVVLTCSQGVENYCAGIR